VIAVIRFTHDVSTGREKPARTTFLVSQKCVESEKIGGALRGRMAWKDSIDRKLTSRE